MTMNAEKYVFMTVLEFPAWSSVPSYRKTYYYVGESIKEALDWQQEDYHHTSIIKIERLGPVSEARQALGGKG